MEFDTLPEPTPSLITKKPPRRLSTANMLRLGELIRTRYVEQALSDRLFAGYAAKELGFDVSDSSVVDVRRALGLAPTLHVKKAAEDATLAGRVTVLEEKMEVLLRERLERGHGNGAKI